MRTFFRSKSWRLGALSKQIFAIAAILTPLVSMVASPAAAQPKYAGIVMDAKTGKVLYSRNADARRYPASLTKMMTLYLVFEDLKRGKIKKSTRIKISRNAANEPPSKLGIKRGQTISVEQAIYSLVTKSANDVATALGEHLAGNEAAFARRMTQKARQLGMNRTIFKNAHGLPNRSQVTTARDMAKLGLALREHFPREFRYFKTRSFAYGRKRYRNNNRLLGKVKGIDGIKTGYTRASGFNLVSTVTRGKRRIVAVVMGGKSGRSRNAQMSRLISKYLGRASRGRARTLIAKARPPRSAIKKNAQLAKNASKNKITVPAKRIAVASIALPTPRPKQVNRIENAFNASKTNVYALGADDIRVKLIALAASSIPLPSPNPQKPDSIVTGATAKTKQVAMSEAEITKPKGWQIQIGATPNKKSAKLLLAKARSKAKNILAYTSNYMEPVAKGNTTLIRARFAGFASKASARKACNYLKKRKFACLAINK